ncbi:MAG: adenine phosphoribosyltransferase [Candidatus Thermoplasmatota archaeon]|nr:adenine phosphoribosyltransferase [Candidatus Thermoplasmatota archaeon]
MSTHIDRLIESIETAPVIDRGSYRYFVHPLSDGVPLISLEMLEDTAESLMGLFPLHQDVDLILTAEAMGIHLATLISINSGLPFSIARKRGYGLKGEVNTVQRTGYSTTDLFINLPEEPGRLILVDDVLSTGGTFKSLASGIERTGWEIEMGLILFNKMALDDRRALEELLGFKVRPLLDVKEVNGSFRAERSAEALEFGL